MVKYWAEITKGLCDFVNQSQHSLKRKKLRSMFKMKRITGLVAMLLILTVFPFAISEESPTEEPNQQSFLDGIGSWFSNAATDVADFATNTANDVADFATNSANDVADWATNAASDVGNWVSNTAGNVWNWTSGTATDAWNGVTGFFNPPATEGLPTISIEPDFPEGTLKMYLGYPAVKTGLDNGYYNVLEIGKDDPHYGLSLGKFYISGFTEAISQNGESFIFLKTVGDEVKLHFELTQDIDMLGNDTFVTINRDVGGYDRQFEIDPTDFGRGTLIVQFTDYQNKTGEPQVYTDYLAAKETGSADTIISLNEEGDYEVALDYEIKKDSYTLGTAIINSSYSDYRIHFKFSVRNGNCMVFPFDLETGEELKNTSIARNGFKLDLAYSRYLDINVKLSTLTEGASGVTEDIRFNRPARDGEEYKQEGIYTITVHNEYTGQETVKTLYVGNDQKLIDYISKGYNIEEIIDETRK